jgi:hypothetical protein
MIIPAGFAQATVTYGGAALPFGAVTTMGLDPTGSLTVEDVAEAFHGIWTTQWDNVLIDAVTMVSTEVKFGPNASGPTAVFTDPITGDLSDSGSPANTAFLVHKNTAIGGRQGRGRIYVPGVSEALVGAAGALTSGTVTSINTLMATIGASLALAGCPCVLLHSDALTPTPITTFSCDGKAATQRRRLRR